jgi:hypothetical protein
MSRDDFNKDMGAYLRERRVTSGTNPFLAAKRFFTKTFSFGTKKAAPREEELQDIPQEQIEAMLEESTHRAPKGAGIRPRAHHTQTVHKEKTTMGWFTKKTQDEEEYDMADAAPAQPVLDEDVKEVLKITFKWLKMMDAETVEEIKATQDFEKYKSVLGKYGLIKK